MQNEYTSPNATWHPLEILKLLLYDAKINEDLIRNLWEYGAQL